MRKKDQCSSINELWYCTSIYKNERHCSTPDRWVGLMEDGLKPLTIARTTDKRKKKNEVSMLSLLVQTSPSSSNMSPFSSIITMKRALLVALEFLVLLSLCRCWALLPTTKSPRGLRDLSTCLSAITSDSSSKRKGKILVLGGTGFLGQNICKRAILEGMDVTSLSRRGLPPFKPDGDVSSTLDNVDYRQGDARNPDAVANILAEGGYTGIVHCVGLLFDSNSGLGELNKFASGSGSLLDSSSTYDAITRQTAFNAIEAAIDYCMGENLKRPLPFVFTSAAEAGWPNVAGGQFIEAIGPDFLKEYLVAKRAVETKLLESRSSLRPVIVRPSLIYTMDRPQSYPAVAGFFLGNGLGLPFIDKPVTVQSLAATIVRSMKDDSISGILRYKDIDRLSR